MTNETTYSTSYSSGLQATAGNEAMRSLATSFVVTQDCDDIPSAEVLEGDQHFLVAIVDPDNEDISLNFSTREALYEFAKALLQEAVFGTEGVMECYPLQTGGRSLVVNGVRMAEGSSRLFLSYPSD